MANHDNIRQDFFDTNWVDFFSNKPLETIVSIFNSKFLEIMTRHIPNKVITVNERDTPWITPEVKTAIKRNHHTYNNWKARGTPPAGKDHVKCEQKDTDALIIEAKVSYEKSIGDKLFTSSTGCNLFWTVINRLIDKKKNCNIPPLFENNVFISSIFNEYFANQCTPLDNRSTLPLS